MKQQRKSIILLIAVLVIFTMACNLLDAIRAQAEEVVVDAVNDTAQTIIDEIDVMSEEQAVQADQPAAEDSTDSEPVPAEEDQPEQPQDIPAWLVGVGTTSLTYFSESDMSPVTLQLNGYIVSAVPSPVGGKVAVIRSEGQYYGGMLWLDIVDLVTGQINTITQLANPDTVVNDWETADICQPPREANFATTYTEPVWTPDGGVVVFVSAHEGLYAAPYAYNLNTGSLYDLLLGGDSHYYNISMSPDGQFITAPTTTCFGTGAGLAMDSYNFARVDGMEAALLLDVSESSNLITWGWLDNRTVVFSLGDMMAGAKNLQAMDIISGEVIAEITGPFDYVSNVAVATGQDALMFTTHMSDIYEYIDGENITNDAVYYWNRAQGHYTQVDESVVWGSHLEWNETMQCFYASLSSGGAAANTIHAYAVDGTPNLACQPNLPGTPVDVQIPQFNTAGDHYAWTVQSWDQTDLNAFYVRDLPNTFEKQVTNSAVSFTWHPTKTILTYMSGSSLYYAAPPDFMSNQVLQSPEELMDFFWATP